MLSAFLRATRDPFLPNRQAAITALAATQVSRVFPHMCLFSFFVVIPRILLEM
ncbi:unnamed protein product [Trichobilharzia regenti]|nr:unnamed protein product [Trichobilharzia regenti]